MRRILPFCFIVFLLVGALGASSQTLNPEDVKHGAVLCAWGIFLAAKEAGETCYHPKDGAFQNALEREIARIDQFIMVNGPATREQLARLKQSPNFKPVLAALCVKNDVRGIYERLRQAGVQKLDAGVSDLLSVPRRPSLVPCL